MSRGTRVRGGPSTTRRSPTGLSPAPARLPSRFGSPVPLDLDRSCRAPQPRPPSEEGDRFGLRPVRSPLLRASLAGAETPVALISLPRGTEMFQFPRCPSRGLCIQPPMTRLAARRVAPFGFGWLIARLQLPTHVSPLSASFFGTWPQRHPPSTLLRLACLRSHDGCPSCSTHTQTRDVVTSASDERSTYDLGTRSLRQNRSKSHCHDRHATRATLAAHRIWTLSRQGLHLVLRLFKCFTTVRRCRRRLRPRRWHRLRNAKFSGHPLRVP